MSTYHSVSSDDAPSYSHLPLSQAMVHEDTVYTAGQIGVDPETGDLVSDDPRQQAVQTLENLDAILTESGSGIEHTLKALIFITDFDHYEVVNDVYEDYVSEPYPARSAIAVPELAGGACVEIEVVAAVPE